MFVIYELAAMTKIAIAEPNEKPKVLNIHEFR